MSSNASIPVGVVIVREEIDSPWQDCIWRAVDVLPGAPPVEGWKELARTDGAIRYHAATVSLELHRKETEAYLYNLEGGDPVLYAVLSENDGEEDGFPYRVHLLTASPFEAQDYLDGGDDIVEPVKMPDEIAVWIEAFVAENHSEEQFKKRKRDEVNLEEHKFGQEPIVVVRERMAREAQLGKAKNGKS